MQSADFDFVLPGELIAQAPPPERTASRLLHVVPAPFEAIEPVESFAPKTVASEATPPDRPDGPAASGPCCPATDRVAGERLDDLRVADLPDLLAPEDLLVLNDTRVIHARLLGRKPTGGRVELLVERVLDARTVLAQLRASHLPAPGGTIRFGPATATLIERRERFFVLGFDVEVEPLLAAHGHLPLPPYIRRPDDATDDERYQTVYARHAGSVAAPTAGLHFDAALLARLRERGIDTAFLTLHVGAGTFQPVQVDDLAQHRMHAERFAIPIEVADAVSRTRARGGRIVAVGTTSLRALEAAARDDGTVRPGESETDLFVLPGYRFRVVDTLLTNFHLPRSTLLMLVSAFAGTDRIRRAYAHAIAQRYRFFSYGDAMLLHRAA